MVLILTDVSEFTLGYGGSTVTIGRSGECRAKLGQIDRSALEKVVGIKADAPSLEERVSFAVRQTLTCFMENDVPTANAILTAKGDADIFHQEEVKVQPKSAQTIARALFIALLLATLLSTVVLRMYKEEHPNLAATHHTLVEHH